MFSMMAQRMTYSKHQISNLYNSRLLGFGKRLNLTMVFGLSCLLMQ